MTKPTGGRDSFRSVLSRIDSTWTPDDWAQFNGARTLTNPLTFLHEATHWCQHRGLVSHSLTLITIRALKDADSPLARSSDLDKVIALRTLLAPLEEGLALYAQYDYFPANFYAGFGPHSTFDSLIEFVVRNGHAYMKDTGRHSSSMHRLHADTHAFYETVRISAPTLRRKRDLLCTPFFIADSHITGYILVKEIVARIRRFPRFHYVHDGLILEALTSFVFDCPLLVDCLFNDQLEGQAFVERVSTILSDKLAFLLDQESVGNTFFQLSGAMRRSSIDGFPVDADAQEAIQQRYSEQFDELIGDDLRSSVAGYIGTEESMADYLDRYDSPDSEWLSPISSHELTYAANFVKLFECDATISTNASGTPEVALPTGRVYSPEALGQCSPRAQRYGWLKTPAQPTKGRLVDGVFELDREYHRVVFVDWNRGLVTLTHNTDDKNIGWQHIGGYFKTAYRIDSCLSEIERRFVNYASLQVRFVADLNLALSTVYLGRIRQEGHNLGISRMMRDRGDSCSNIFDIFDSATAVNSYVALSLLVRIYDFMRESATSLNAAIDKYAPRFDPEPVDVKLMKRWVTCPEPHCYVQQFQGGPMWSSFGCYL